MHCRNCGSEVHEKAIACPKCGIPPLAEKKFCQECGSETKEKQMVCIKCGVKLVNKGSGGIQGLNLKGAMPTDMPIPLLVGWIVTVLSFILYIVIDSTFSRVIMVLILAGCIYVAYAHVKLGSEPAIDKRYLGPKWLLYISIFYMIVIFAGIIFLKIMK